MNFEALLHHYGLLAVFVGAGLEGETVVIAGGILAHQGYAPLWAAIGAAIAGSFLVDQAWFYAGRRFRDHRWVRRARENPAFGRALAMLEAHPVGFIFVFRFLYGLRTVSPIAIGTTWVEARLFLTVNAVSAVVWGIAFTSIGYLFGHAFERFVGRLVPDTHALLIAAGAVVAGVALFQGVRWWRGRMA